MPPRLTLFPSCTQVETYGGAEEERTTLPGSHGDLGAKGKHLGDDDVLRGLMRAFGTAMPFETGCDAQICLNEGFTL